MQIDIDYKAMKEAMEAEKLKQMTNTSEQDKQLDFENKVARIIGTAILKNDKNYTDDMMQLFKAYISTNYISKKDVEKIFDRLEEKSTAGVGIMGDTYIPLYAIQSERQRLTESEGSDE